MPSTYAHYRFGQEIFRALPEQIRKEIEPFQELYYIGVHGPDILYYYKPLSSNRINRIGFGMHEEPACKFFMNSCEVIRGEADMRSSYAFLCGFITHFVLDSECHGYIDEKIAESGISHTEIETEFDRDLMEKDGFNPVSHHLTGHIRPTAENARVIAAFFEEVTADEIQRALKSMISYNNLLIAPHRIKRLMIYTLLAASGNYKEIRGMLVNLRANANCEDSTRKLRRLYDNALYQAIKLICEYKECIGGQKPLNARYRLTFGSKEPAVTEDLVKI